MIHINDALAFNRLETARNCTRFSEFRNIFFMKNALAEKVFFVT